MVDIVLASRNRHKTRELKAMFAKISPMLDLNVQSLADYDCGEPVKEDGGSFRENAAKKALAVARATNRIAVADDSGLEVDALAGRPGVLSARFAGEDASDKDNNEKLLAMLRDVPERRRQARFVCHVALANPEGLIEVVEASCNGTIAFKERGSGGFGYDPLFIPLEYNKTFAELPPDVKNRISHRAKAFEKALLALEKYLYKRQLKEKG